MDIFSQGNRERKQERFWVPFNEEADKSFFWSLDLYREETACKYFMLLAAQTMSIPLQFCIRLFQMKSLWSSILSLSVYLPLM